MDDIFAVARSRERSPLSQTAVDTNSIIRVLDKPTRFTDDQVGETKCSMSRMVGDISRRSELTYYLFF